MDKELNTKMINGNLLCKNVSSDTVVSESGFEVKVETKFKTLKVLESSEQSVPKGSEIVVPYHSGQEYEGLTIMNIKNIIYIK